LARRILSVTYIDGAYHYLEADRQAGGLFPRTSVPQVAETEEALSAVCQKADEIYFCGEFSSALYQWAALPRVTKRYLPNLVRQDAREKVEATAQLQVRFETLGDVVERGGPRTRVAYVAVHEGDLTPIWSALERVMKKVKAITPLPVALASAVAQADKPDRDFIVTWVGEHSTVIVISSPQGQVKMARSLPLSLPAEPMAADPEEARRFSETLSREISMTTTFFKQEFRSGVPEVIYFLGTPRLKGILEEFVPFGVPPDQRFQLSSSLVQNMGEAETNTAFHLVSNFFSPVTYNFLPEETVTRRRTDVLYAAAVAVLVLLIVAAGIWDFQLYSQKQSRITDYHLKYTELKQLQADVAQKQAEVDRLKPFEGWKRFYEDTFENRPAWNRIYSELALILPDNILLNNFALKAPSGRQEAAGPLLESEIAGEIQADNWEQGLSMLREFGERLQMSPLFDVTEVEYTPRELAEVTKIFTFKIGLKLVPQRMAHES